MHEFGVRKRARSGWAERHRNTVHAIAQPGRLRTVVEHVTEVTTAAPTEHLGACHADAVVLALEYGTVERLPETRPPGAAVEFGVGGKQVERAARTTEHPVPVLIVERAAVRRF